MNADRLAPSEQSIVDLFRIALTGDDVSMRKLCRRLMRRPPSDTAHPAQFKAALSEVLALAPTPVVPSPLRRAQAPAQSSAPTWDSSASSNDDLAVRARPADAPRPILGPSVENAIQDVVAEHRHPEALEQFGLTPSRAVLFTGPPGVGKTMTATFIASELAVPLITVDIASLMSSFLGRTGRNLQSVVEDAMLQPCVLFLDEFDAIARSRREDSDVGEVRRVVTVLLQQLDRWPPGGLLIAATNHEEALDSAVLRRFDQTIPFALPDFDSRRASIAASTVTRSAQLSELLVNQAALATQGWSHSDIERWLARLARAAVLRDEADEPRTAVQRAIAEATIDTLQAQAKDSLAFRHAVIRIAHDELNLSHRQIAPLVGVTHVAVGNYLRGVQKLADGPNSGDHA